MLLAGRQATVRLLRLAVVLARRFVGLVDAKADRAVGVLEVRKLRYDGPANQRARFDAALRLFVRLINLFKINETPKLTTAPTIARIIVFTKS